MISAEPPNASFQIIRDRFGDRVKQKVSMAKYTSTHVGGPADVVLTAKNASELEIFSSAIWELGYPLLIIGYGSNILVSDKGIRGVVILNHADRLEVKLDMEPPSIVADSGVSLATLARLAADNSLTGLEWSSPIPGSVGGAIYGNAGAHGGEICKNLILAKFLHRTKGRLSLNSAQMQFGYRTSLLKGQPKEMVILSAVFGTEKGNKDQILAKMKEINEKRRCDQPAGPSFGSTFRNPAGFKAGKLIEEAGLKEARIGNAVVSTVHANFIINHGRASASDFIDLMLLMQKSVQEKFGVHLVPEIELVGEWDERAQKLTGEAKNV